MKKNVIFLLCLIITIILIMSMNIFAIEFSDLLTNHWAYEYITELTNEGVINGYPDGTYRPEGTVTNAEYLKLILTASLGKQVSDKIKPVDGVPFSHWALGYRNIAERIGLFLIYIDESNLDESITRLEMAIILAKAHEQFDRSENIEGDLIQFNDLDEYSELYTEYIDYVTKMGLINGYPDGTFRPDSNMTRAEVAVVLSRYIENIRPQVIKL